MNPTKRPLIALLIAACLGGASCQSDYYPVRYVPVPLEARVESPADAKVSGRVLVTILGVRRADEDAGRPAGVEMRVRVENLGAVSFALDPADLRLLSADLRPFAPPQVTPPQAVDVPPDGSTSLDVYFPFPDEESVQRYAMDSLNLRWTVVIEGGERVTAAATFDRLYGPDRGPNWGLSLGVGL